MSTNSSSSYGIGFPGLLTIVFIVLKLTHYIDWSWWWVTVPLWGGLAIALLFIGLMFILSMARK
jgi:hypothetical protein